MTKSPIQSANEGKPMSQQELRALIAAADDAINREDFDALMAFYADDATLVVKPGMLAQGKAQIRQAFEAIAAYFNHSLRVSQGEMTIIEAGDTALVISRTLLSAHAKTDSPFAMERAATYVFRKDAAGAWRCAVDNSYGTELLMPG
ncbi:SgcJ/EcaC family oxidoreductase [Crenobacter sp. SG2305]|uniref:YybH family protein n=1 Tax=Crenobacter oryzisoli TaxID=3056844 RepID=UPI0025AAC699|nr:SgcJ/EcaC family oxidoreductase [Crenobacter sp. SG2305]MDN0082738.1 SgcJ/EcaC family oxidoreductase [Crenobacter sp. SG2305]